MARASSQYPNRRVWRCTFCRRRPCSRSPKIRIARSWRSSQITASAQCDTWISNTFFLEKKLSAAQHRWESVGADAVSGCGNLLRIRSGRRHKRGNAASSTLWRRPGMTNDYLSQKSGAGIQGVASLPSPPCSMPMERTMADEFPRNEPASTSRSRPRAGVLHLASVSRRLFRPRVPGRRFLRGDPAGVLASTVLFTAIPLLRDRRAFQSLRAPGPHRADSRMSPPHWPGPATSSGSAISKPSIVNTMHSGMGPLTVVIMAALGFRVAKTGPVGRARASRLRRHRMSRSRRSPGSCFRAGPDGPAAARRPHSSGSRRFWSAARRSPSACCIASGCTIAA